MMSQSVTFTELGPADFRQAIDQFVAVYSAAMNPPERMLAGRGSILERHSVNPGFRALAAVITPGDDPTASPGTGATASPGPRGLVSPSSAGEADAFRLAPGMEIAGFTYGFHGVHGQWWHDMVASALAVVTTPSGTTAATAWLADSFEVAELHVLPAYQGAGIGRSLLLRLLSGRPEQTALLSTQDAESKARRLYRGVGFTDLLTGFRFSGGEPPYAVMGATLPLRPARHDAGGHGTDPRNTGSGAAGSQRPDAASSPLPPDLPRPSIS
jgi:ribosomal protein S18 acetylase RimI-like enzyme